MEDSKKLSKGEIDAILAKLIKPTEHLLIEGRKGKQGLVGEEDNREKKKQESGSSNGIISEE